MLLLILTFRHKLYYLVSWKNNNCHLYREWIEQGGNLLIMWINKNKNQITTLNASIGPSFERVSFFQNVCWHFTSWSLEVKFLDLPLSGGPQILTLHELVTTPSLEVWEDSLVDKSAEVWKIHLPNTSHLITYLLLVSMFKFEACHP